MGSSIPQSVSMGGIEHDVAGHLCSGTCGIGRNLRDSCAHAAEPKPQPVGSLAHASNAHGTQLVARAPTLGCEPLKRSKKVSGTTRTVPSPRTWSTPLLQPHRRQELILE